MESGKDSFRITINDFPEVAVYTKRSLTSDIARIFDVLGWFSPSIVQLKILLQRLWEAKVAWDDPVPQGIESSWRSWRDELPLIKNLLIPRCYIPKDHDAGHLQLHAFSDASEDAYAGVVYLRSRNEKGVHTSLVIAKTKVAPIKRLSIPRLELCGAVLATRLLHHTSKVLAINNVAAWTDSTVVLDWLQGNPRRFKPFVGNRVSEILSLVPANVWRHVASNDNPADAASRGLSPAGLMDHHIWWNGPGWLSDDESNWPEMPQIDSAPLSEEEKPTSLALVAQVDSTLLDTVSNYNHLKRVTAWILRFVHNCRTRATSQEPCIGALTVAELDSAERHWLVHSQGVDFSEEITVLRRGKGLMKGRLLSLHPFLDSRGLLRVGGRQALSQLPYNQRHPIILSGKNKLTRMIMQAEHLRLLHAGPTLMAGSLARRFHILGARRQFER